MHPFYRCVCWCATGTLDEDNQEIVKFRVTVIMEIVDIYNLIHVQLYLSYKPGVLFILNVRIAITIIITICSATQTPMLCFVLLFSISCTNSFPGDVFEFNTIFFLVQFPPFSRVQSPHSLMLTRKPLASEAERSETQETSVKRPL